MQIDLLIGRVEIAEIWRGINYVPEKLHAATTGDCFQQANCPALQSANVVRPCKTLVRCKRYIGADPKDESEDRIGAKLHVYH